VRAAWLLLVLATGCKMMVETYSPPTQLRLQLASTCDDRVHVRGPDGQHPPELREIAPAAPGRYIVDVPGMGGGYTEQGGKVSNVHDPDTYRVIEVLVGDTVARQLSIADVRALPKEPDGAARVDVACAP
jgi:hypothetical protein